MHSNKIRKKEKSGRSQRTKRDDVAVFDVFKSVYPDLSISVRGMFVLVGIYHDLLGLIVDEAVNLGKMRGRCMIKARDVQTSVRLITPALAKYADEIAFKAVESYRNTFSTSSMPESPSARTTKANLTLSIERVLKDMRKKKYLPKFSIACPIYLTGLLQYFLTEIITSSGKATMARKRSRVFPRDITIAVRTDEELSRLIKGTIASGGVIPHIHRAVLYETFDEDDTSYLKPVYSTKNPDDPYPLDEFSATSIDQSTFNSKHNNPTPTGTCSTSSGTGNTFVSVDPTTDPPIPSVDTNESLAGSFGFNFKDFGSFPLNNRSDNYERTNTIPIPTFDIDFSHETSSTPPPAPPPGSTKSVHPTATATATAIATATATATPTPTPTATSTTTRRDAPIPSADTTSESFGVSFNFNFGDFGHFGDFIPIRR